MSVMRVEIKTTTSIQFVNLFHFTQKSKQAFHSGLALKKPAQ